MKRAAALLLLVTACGGSSPPPATPVPPKRDAAVGTAPASREPLFLELVVIPRKWVTKYAPDGSQATDLTKNLGAELTKQVRSAPDMRAAIAESVQHVLGDSAVADPDRPKTHVVERDRIKEMRHLSAAVKAGLTQFADHAHAGDVLDTPASDEDVVVVARAVAARS